MYLRQFGRQIVKTARRALIGLVLAFQAASGASPEGGALREPVALVEAGGRWA